jgi:hypothetical protein
MFIKFYLVIFAGKTSPVVVEITVLGLVSFALA